MDLGQFKKYVNAFKGFNRHNNISVLEVGDGSSIARCKLGDDSLNPQGSAHGGLLFALADTAAGVACMSHGRLAVTQDASANYLRPAMGSFVTATAVELHYGRSTGVYRVELADDKDRLVAHFTVTMALTQRTLEL